MHLGLPEGLKKSGSSYPDSRLCLLDLAGLGLIVLVASIAEKLGMFWLLLLAR